MGLCFGFGFGSVAVSVSGFPLQFGLRLLVLVALSAVPLRPAGGAVQEGRRRALAEPRPSPAPPLSQFWPGHGPGGGLKGAAPGRRFGPRFPSRAVPQAVCAAVRAATGFARLGSRLFLRHERAPKPLVKRRSNPGQTPAKRAPPTQVDRALEEDDKRRMAEAVWTFDGQPRRFESIVGRRKKKKDFEYEVQWQVGGQWQVVGGGLARRRGGAGGVPGVGSAVAGEGGRASRTAGRGGRNIPPEPRTQQPSPEKHPRASPPSNSTAGSRGQSWLKRALGKRRAGGWRGRGRAGGRARALEGGQPPSVGPGVVPPARGGARGGARPSSLG